MTAPDRTLVDAVARAIHAVDDHGNNLHFDAMSSIGIKSRNQYLRLAQAAIAACRAEEMVRALRVFDEAMRNGSMGMDAEKHKRRALKAAHRKASAVLAKLDGRS